MKGYRLPEGILLGVASTATEIEGGSVRTNWDEWSRTDRIRDGADSRRAAGHWERVRSDLDLMAALGVQTYRFSVEWARIQPEPDRIDYEAVNHYRDELISMKSRGIRPILTIHEFTNPIWFERRGAFTRPANVRSFLRYVGLVVNCFGDLVSDYVTFDAPNVYAWMGYAGHGFPPGDSNLITVRRVLSVMAGCHIRAYEKIHRMREAMGYTDTRVGVALAMRSFAALHPFSTTESQAARISQYLYQELPARAFLLGDFRFPMENLARFRKGTYCDYLGLDYCTRSHVVRIGDNETRAQDPKSDCGKEIYPQGLEDAMRELYAICQKPVWILANGVCDNSDAFRSLWLYDQLAVLARTSLPVERYCYYSFLDGFEWLGGESRRYGLVHVDFESGERRVKRSGHFYREIIACRGVTEELAERYVKAQQYHP